MEIAYAFLANAAEGTPDGRINVLGGDFDTVQVATLPAVIPLIAVVIRFSCTVDDSGSRHRCRIEIPGVAGIATDAEIDVPNLEHRATSKVMAITHIAGVVFNNAGMFPVEISLDGKLVRSLPLHVVQIHT
jgi:hypothetical protein